LERVFLRVKKQFPLAPVCDRLMVLPILIETSRQLYLFTILITDKGVSGRAAVPESADDVSVKLVNDDLQGGSFVSDGYVHEVIVHMLDLDGLDLPAEVQSKELWWIRLSKVTQDESRKGCIEVQRTSVRVFRDVIAVGIDYVDLINILRNIRSHLICLFLLS